MMMSNATLMEDCNLTDSVPNSDFFIGLFENRPSKVAAVVFSAVGWVVIVPLMFAIIVFERSSSDNKKTLLNKLVSSMYWLCLEWLFFVQVGLL
jgi:hypothetical protein